MNNELLLALIDSIVDDAIKKQISVIEGPRGQRGPKGRDGRDFYLEDHSEAIKQLVLENLPTEINLTDEQLLAIKAKDFSFEESREHIANLIKENAHLFKLHFSDLSEEEIQSLKGEKGPRGQRGRQGDKGDKGDSGIDGVNGRDGKDGKDFSFEECQEQITNILLTAVDSVKDQLKLKFSDLSEEELQSLKGEKGPRGQRGRQGDSGENGTTWHSGQGSPENLEATPGDFYFDFSNGDIYVRSQDTWEKKSNIKGMQGLRGLPGVQGIPGIQGRSGIDGRDGKDAPTIVDIRLDQNKDNISLVFEMSDGTYIESNEVTLPKVVAQIAYAYSTVSGGGGGATEIEVYKDGALVLSTSKLDFTGANVSVTDVGGTATLSFTDTNTTDMEVYKDGTLVATSNKIDFTGSNISVTDVGGVPTVAVTGGGGGSIAIEDEGNEITSAATRINFIGDYITARPRTTLSQWPTLDAVTPSLLDYLGTGAQDQIDVYVDIPDSSILKNVACLTSVFVGSFVYINGSGQAVNARADDYTTSNVIGLVESKSAIDRCNIRVSGISSELFTGLDTSLDYFLSAVNAGEYSASVPIASGHIKLKLGQSFGTTKFLFAKGERVVRL